MDNFSSFEQLFSIGFSCLSAQVVSAGMVPETYHELCGHEVVEHCVIMSFRRPFQCLDFDSRSLERRAFGQSIYSLSNVMRLDSLKKIGSLRYHYPEIQKSFSICETSVCNLSEL